MGMKICGKCKIEKSTSEFSIRRANKDGLDYYCKSCTSIKNKQYYRNNSEYIKQQSKKYRKNNIGYYRQYNKRYYENNAEQIKEYKKQWQNNLCKTNKGNLNNKMYLLINRALKGRQISPTLMGMVGYTPQEVRDHFESLFTDTMSWLNYGKWQVDHIHPICSFNYSSPDDPEFQECWALNNLQPLWYEDNMKKGTKVYGNL